MPQTILIIGGYGNAGMAIADLLLQTTDTQILIAGRDLARAKAGALALCAKFGTGRAQALQLDVSRHDRLDAAFRQARVVVIASSTMADTEAIAKAALANKCRYMDIQLSSPKKLAVLRSLQSQIADAKLTFITDGGFHPGMPGAMIRHAASYFDALQRAEVASLLRVNWRDVQISPETKLEFVQELMHTRQLVFEQGEWRTQRFRDAPKFDFGLPFGRQWCVPMFLEELHRLPGKIPALQRAGFFISGFGGFIDFVIFPAVMVLLKLAPEKALHLAAKWLYWGLRTFSHPPYRSLLLLEATGMKSGKPHHLRMTVSHENAYWLTAAPVVACLCQLLEKSPEPSGLWCQAEYVDTERFFADIQRFGIDINIEFEHSS